MKILFLTKSFPVFGGVERWLADLVIGLETLDVEVTVALASGQNFNKPSAYMDAYPKLNFMELDGLSGSSYGRRKATKAAIKKVRPDIVVPVMLADGLIGACEIKQQFSFHIIYPVHEITIGVENDLSSYGVFIDQIVFVDQSGLDKYGSSFTGCNEKSQLIPCGVPEADLNEKQKDSLSIGFCGRLESQQKRVMDLIPFCDSFESLGLDFYLTIAGQGSKKAELQLALEHELGPERVQFLPGQSRDKLYSKFYKEIDVLLITSDWETGPLVAFEAMMNGVAIVTADFLGREESNSLIQGGNCLVFPVGDMNQAAKRINDLLEDPKLYSQLVQDGWKYAMDNRRLQTMVTSWYELFQQVSKYRPLIAVTKPSVKKIKDGGRMTNLRIPDGIAVLIRRMLGLRYSHAHAGEEWPHYTSFRKHPFV